MERPTAGNHAELAESLRHQGQLIASLTEQVRDLADRLRRLEEVRTPAPTGKPLRVSRQAAAKLLEVSPNTISVYASRGLLLKLPKRAGVGRGATTYFHPDNVAALAQSEDVAREWVAKREFVPLGKRLTDGTRCRALPVGFGLRDYRRHQLACRCPDS